ncbi:MAG: sulfite exporter TauE/SafE family protein [Patescibacteria group bacterium]|jgi:sulfite exporter TauE/SafE/copper chaperone CopZ
MKKLTIPIKGMHCKSCEMLIEDKLKEVTGVKKSVLNHKRGIAEIHYEAQKPRTKEIEKAIRSAGYEIGAEKDAGRISRDINDYKDLGLALAVILGVYLALKSFGITGINFGSSLTQPGSLPVVLLIGVTAGFSTCMALVGGLVLGTAARFGAAHPEATAFQKFKPHLFFNLGRILGFALLGGVLGIIGSVFQFNGLTLGGLTIIVALIMLLMGLQLIGIFPGLNSFKLTLPKFISRGLGIKTEAGKYSHLKSALLGALTFFLPCGFTQAMQLFAVSTGSFQTGALVMGTFALGTAPGLLGVGGITALVKGIFARRFFKFAGLLVIIFALFNLINGYNLTGLSFGEAGRNEVNAVQSDPNVTMENNVQVVKMAEVSNGYTPNRFTIKKGIPVRWVIDAQAPNSCASTIVLSKYNIVKSLVAGENIIEFTPAETGTLKFSCSMGMYTGVFNVVDETGQGAAENDLTAAVKKTGGSCDGSSRGCASGGCAMASGGTCGCGQSSVQ